ncbi:MAG: hypothetical protein HGA66_18000, partial [Holophaga sp.]|nr:hypothetical protein [Holophaga sp.]
RQTDEVDALRRHLVWLTAEQDRLARQAASIRRTLTARDDGGRLMAHDMLDGFDHTRYRDEVEDRWGTDAYATSDQWWRAMDDAERAAWKNEQERLQEDWRRAAGQGVAGQPRQGRGGGRREPEDAHDPLGPHLGHEGPLRLDHPVEPSGLAEPGVGRGRPLVSLLEVGQQVVGHAQFRQEGGAGRGGGEGHLVAPGEQGLPQGQALGEVGQGVAARQDQEAHGVAFTGGRSLRPTGRRS